MMPELVLVIEASTSDASVALIRDDELLIQELVPSHHSGTGKRSEGLMPAIAKCLAYANVVPKQLASIVCGGGPGGFTSLRSAAAIAKGMCTALRIPLYALSTMELLVAAAQLPAGWYVTALDAGRDEVYATTVRIADEQPELGPVLVVPPDQLHALASEMHATLVGPHREIDVIPRAACALPLLDALFSRGPVDPETWEPAYGRLAEAQVKWEAAQGRPLAL
jgi:tRNA threonylcarbamoyladenosine biosynthesis protein TsaB